MRRDAVAKVSMRRYLVFFAMTYGLSAPFWIAGMFIQGARLPLDIPILDIFAALTPTIAALWMSYREGGLSKVMAILKRAINFRSVPKKAWVVAVIVPVALFVLIALALSAQGKDIGDFVAPYASIFIFSALFLFAGSVLEEVGYTAYLTDTVEQFARPFFAAILIGVPWACWHIPSMLLQGRTWEWIFWGVVGTIAFRWIYVWIYHMGNRTIAPVIVAHFIYNLGRTLFPAAEAGGQPLVLYPEVHYGMTVLLALPFAYVLLHMQVCKLIK